MSSTSNSQNLLVNVFRPTYVYDQAKGYIPKLIVSNVDNIVGINGTFSNLNIGDVNSNVYVGSNSGNVNTLVSICNSTRVTALGVSAGSNNSNCVNSLYIGTSAGSNTTGVLNSVYMGYLTGQFNSNCANSVYIGNSVASNLCNVSNQVVVGANAIAGGNSNVYVGAYTGSTGVSNVFVGPQIAPGNVSNQVRIGVGSNIPFFADMTSKFVGINTTTPAYNLDVSGDARFSGKIGIQTNPDKSLDINGQTRSTGGYVSSQSSNVVANGTYILGPIKPGIIMVSAVDIADGGNYAGYTFFATSVSNIVAMSSAIGGTADIDRSGTNIVLLNGGATTTYKWNITYFPLDSA